MPNRRNKAASLTFFGVMWTGRGVGVGHSCYLRLDALATPLVRETTVYLKPPFCARNFFDTKTSNLILSPSYHTNLPIVLKKIKPS